MFRKPSLTSDYEHVYSRDPAVDREHPDFDHEQWRKTGLSKYIPLRDGAAPVRFKLRHLRGRARNWITDFGAAHGFARVAFEACALALADVAGGKMEDGQDFELVFEHDKHSQLSRVSARSMDVLYAVDDGALVVELGARAVTETFGDPT